MKQISERVQLLNDKSANNNGKYVLYWIQMFKRAAYSHALNHAIGRHDRLWMERPIYGKMRYMTTGSTDRIRLEKIY